MPESDDQVYLILGCYNFRRVAVYRHPAAVYRRGRLILGCFNSRRVAVYRHPAAVYHGGRHLADGLITRTGECYRHGSLLVRHDYVISKFTVRNLLIYLIKPY